MLIMLGPVIIVAQQERPRGDPYSSKANQALEQCFDSLGNFLCLEPAYGELYVSTPAATTNSSGTPLKALGTTTLGDAEQFDMPANNRLRYTGAETKTFQCECSSSVESDTGSTLVMLFLADTGAVDLTSEIDRLVASAAVHGAMALGFIVELAQNEYVEVWLDSGAGNPDITLDHMTLRCHKID